MQWTKFKAMLDNAEKKGDLSWISLSIRVFSVHAISSL